MADRNRPQPNESAYVTLHEDQENLSESYSIKPTRNSSSSRKPTSHASPFKNFSGNRQPIYQPLPTGDFQEEEEEEEEEGEEEEVPASLMVEMPRNNPEDDRRGTPAPGWNFVNQGQRQQPNTRSQKEIMKELTMWKWANVENLDSFLGQVYAYYIGKGMNCILLNRVLSLLQLGFVIGFSVFLIGCVDYSSIRHSKKLSEVVIAQCFSRLSGLSQFFVTIFCCFFVYQVFRLILDIGRLNDMFNFYTYLLEIPDDDIQTVSWQRIVNQIVRLRDNNPTTSHQVYHLTQDQPQQRLDAHNIANRIMRQENYLIALINKDILKLTIPLPFLNRQQILTKTLEWNLNLCIMDYAFNDEGQVKKKYLKDVPKEELTKGLSNRFVLMGWINLIFAPFIVVYLLMFFFFRYFDVSLILSLLFRDCFDFTWLVGRSNPSSIGSRQWSPFARWMFREFNELPHLFQTRLNNSYEPAMKYINQFPKEKSVLVARFVSFIAGSFAAILLLATVIDPELFRFEITPERTLIFYLGLCGTILHVSRGLIPDEHSVFDPEMILKEVIEYTHYLPDDWREDLHAEKVRKGFAQLFDMKIVDFFREFTLHVEGVGYVCSFAVFDFKRHGNVKYGAPTEVANEYYISNQGKMEKSFLNFKANHPDWEPTDPTGSAYLTRLTEFNNQINPERTSNTRLFGIDSILRNNRRGSNIPFGTSKGHINAPHARRSSLGFGIDSLLQEDGPSDSPQGPTLRKNVVIGTTEQLNSSHSPQENYESELGDSYFLTGAKSGNDVLMEQDRPRQVGIFNLLNQFYELDKSAI
ncbi:hypothetical protein G9A89_013350 [Geosiphon pyriformis]|nr:hypothetical protein G9A89_013350 [Geosiphon pyriformis]